MKNYLLNKVNHPIYAIENSDTLISKEKGVLSFGFSVHYPNLYGKTTDDFNQLRGLYNKLIDIMGENSIIQKTEFFINRPYDDEIDSPTFIEEFNFQHFKGRKVREQISYIFFSSVPENYLKYESNHTNQFLKKEKSGNIFKPLIDKEYISKENMILFEKKKKAITQILQKSLLKGELLETQEQFNKLFSLWENLSLDKKITTDLDITKGEINLGNRKLNTYTVEKLDQFPDVLPEYLHDTQKTGGTDMYIPKSLLSPLGLEIKEDHILNQYFYIPAQEQYLKMLKKKENVLGNFAIFFSDKKEKNKSVDEEKNAIFQGQIESFRKEILDKHQKVVLTHTNVIAEDISTSEDFPILLRQNVVDTLDLYFATCGGNAIGLPADLYCPITQEQAFSFFYCEDYTKGNSYDGFRVIDILSGNPEKLDIFRTLKRRKDITAYNAWSVGATGSGKSFLWNAILMHYFNLGEHVFNIDGSSSFERSTNFINYTTKGKHGFFMKISTDTKIGLNPFLVLKGEKRGDKISTLQYLLLTILDIANDSEAQIVGGFFIEILNRYYDIELERKFNTFYEFLKENSESIVKEFGIEDIINVKKYIFLLKEFYQGGIYDYLLNNSDERLQDIKNNRYITFQIKELKDNPALFAIVTLLLTNLYKSKLYSPELLEFIKFIHYDEVWTAMDKPLLVGFIKDTIKTVRSQNGGTIFTSQEPEDFFESEIIKNAVLNNSELGFVLNISKYSGRKKYVQELLSLTESQANVIFSLGKKLPEGINCREFALLVGRKYIKTYGMEVSNEEKAIYESDPEEKVKLARLDEKNNSNPIITAKEYAELNNQKNREL